MHLVAFLSFASLASALPSSPPSNGPALDDYLRSVATPVTIDKRQSNATTTTNATVMLCTAPDFGGECYHATWPVNTCIDLAGYAGNTQSFQPEEGRECLVMQGRCDANEAYVSIGDDDDGDVGKDLSGLEWIEEASSYMCFTEIEALRRFVRVARLRAQKQVQA